jgi:hypothetical protein
MAAFPLGDFIVNRAVPELPLEAELPFSAAMPVRSRKTTERRGAERLPLAVPVFVRGTSAQGEFLEFTTALNVSASGMLVGLQRELPLGARVVLEVAAADVPGHSGPRSTRALEAELVRLARAGEWNLCGFRFLQPLT